ncbi:MAG: C2H2-type zinc finger protein [Eubacterium sp.]|nr:C2H2-type zinc finger protein [Eubacterium sp.]
MNNTENKTELSDEELDRISGGRNNNSNGKNADDSGKTVYKCNFCGETFNSKHDLKTHVNSYHK